MKNACRLSVLVLATVAMVSPVTAETEAVEPRLLSLSDTADTVLPGDQTGTSHGVKVNRGSGFPEPVIAVVEPEAEAVEPAPRPRRRVVRRRSRW